MAIKVECGNCGRTMSVKDSLAGKKGKCPGCGGIIEVPMQAEEPEEIVVSEPEAPEEPEAPVPPEEEVGPTKACVHCGRRIPVAALFCVHCGTHLRTGEKHEGEDESSQASDEHYDFIKTAPDLIIKPVDAIGTIVESPMSSVNFKKALIMLGIGLVIFAFVLSFNDETKILTGLGGFTFRPFILALVLAIVGVILDGIIINAAGTSVGTTGTGFAPAFMAVMAAHAMMGIVMILVALYIMVPNAPFAGSMVPWLVRLIRFGWGTVLFYFIMSRAFEPGLVPSIVTAVACTGVRGVLFWLIGNLIFKIPLI